MAASLASAGGIQLLLRLRVDAELPLGFTVNLDFLNLCLCSEEYPSMHVEVGQRTLVGVGSLSAVWNPGTLRLLGL